MKSILNPRMASILLAGLLAACSATTADDNKEARVEKLKDQRDKITAEIEKLEGDLAKEKPVETNIKAKEVNVVVLEPQRFDHFVRLQGKIEAEDNINVSAQTPGLIVKVYAKEGQHVSRGQTLAQLDNATILKNIEDVNTQLRLASTLYERQKSLWDQQIGTEVQYLQAKNNKESLENRLALLEELNKMTRIASPINGTVDEVFIKIGQSINPGMPAVRVVNTSALKAVSMVSEAYINDINVGNQVHLKIADLKKTMDARVSFVSKTIDPLSRSFEVESKLPSTQGLLPNMTLVMEVVFHTDPSAIVVPVNVVQEINGEKGVYVAEQSGDHLVAKMKRVSVIGVYDAKAQVEGLQAGDRVITVGYQGLNDGEYLSI